MVGPEPLEVVLEEVLEGAEYEDDCLIIPDHGDTNELTLRLFRHWKTNTWLMWDGNHDTN